MADGSMGSTDVWTNDSRWPLAGFWARFDALMKRHEVAAAEKAVTALEDEFVTVALANNSRDVAEFVVSPRLSRAEKQLAERRAELAAMESEVAP
jgi:hypothetical protein